MEYAGTPGSRAVVNDSPFFLGLWLAGWVTGEVFALRQLLSPSPLPAKAFLAVWLAFWTFGGTAALSICVWMLAGHERVRLRTDALTIQREAFGLGPMTVYEFDRIRNFRAQPPDGRPVVPAEKAAAVLRVVGIGGPGISFTYSGRPVRFGVALDPDEAHSVAAQLEARHSFADGQSAA